MSYHVPSVENLTEFLDVSLDLQHVQRYHMCGLNRKQNVAEHSFNAAMIAWETAVWLQMNGMEWRKIISPYRVVMRTLLHDIEEAFVGDIAQPVKNTTEDFRKEYDIVSDYYMQDWRRGLPDYVLDEFEDPPYSSPIARKVEDQIVKSSDILELTLFAIDEYMRGNKLSEVIVLTGRKIFLNIDRHYYLRLDTCPLERLSERIHHLIGKEIKNG